MNPNTSFSNPLQKINGLLVIDGDWLAYKVASILEKKEVRIFDLDGNFVNNFKNKTEYKNSPTFNPNFEIKDAQKLIKSHQSTMDYRLRVLVKTFLDATGCTEVLIAMGGPDNFRDELKLPQKYKGNRDGTLRPLALKETRDRVAELFPTIYSVGEEADDIISKYQYTYSQDKSTRIVVCTLDKDARGTPGLLYNPDKGTLVDIDGLGFLTITKGNSGYKLYGEGRKWFYSQLLTGDKADNYFPCDLHRALTSNPSKSPVITDYKCFNLLNECKTDAECLTVLKNTYYEWYKDVTSWTTWTGETVKGDWIDILQMYFDVVHMRRFDGDRVDVRNLLARFGLLTNG